MSKKSVRRPVSLWFITSSNGWVLEATTAQPQLMASRRLQDRGISEETAMQMLEEDIDICIAELKANFAHFDDYPDVVQEVLVDLCFNLGISRLLRFSKTIEYLNEGLATGNYTKAAVELMDSAYARQLPARSKRNHDLLYNAWVASVLVGGNGHP